jgi:IS5 family transposase
LPPFCHLAEQIDWNALEMKLGLIYIPDDETRIGYPMRLMVGLHYLKERFALSDESVVEGFLENPYWQYFCGWQYFEHRLSVSSSVMTRWRRYIAAKGLEETLNETLRTAEVRNGTRTENR